ncbi:hypothetical protein GJ496_007237 [Pomphorhynchus laevis]|nr:hypothetical protein GJ496_007237 [Pomphorhynchus laevis]
MAGINEIDVSEKHHIEDDHDKQQVSEDDTVIYDILEKAWFDDIDHSDLNNIQQQPLSLEMQQFRQYLVKKIESDKLTACHLESRTLLEKEIRISDTEAERIVKVQTVDKLNRRLFYMFNNDIMFRYLLSYYVTVQFPRCENLVFILNELIPNIMSTTVDGSERRVVSVIQEAIDGLQETYNNPGEVNTPIPVMKSRLNAFLNYQFNRNTLHPPTSRSAESLTSVLLRFNELVPDLIASNQIHEFINSKILPVLSSSSNSSSSVEQQDAAALFLARLHFEYRMTHPSAALWLNQLTNGGEATDCGEQPGDNNSRIGSNTNENESVQTLDSDLLSSLVSLPSTLSHVIQLATDQKLRPSATGALISRISEISCSAVLTLIVCTYRLKQVASHSWQPYVNDILSRLSVELVKESNSSDKTICLCFVHYTYQAFIERPSCNSLMSTLRFISRRSYGYFQPSVAEAIRDCLLVYRGSTPILAHLIGILVNSGNYEGSNVHVNCQAIIVCLCLNNSLEILEALLNEIFPECLYERPTDLLSSNSIDTLSVLCYVAVKISLHSTTHSDALNSRGRNEDVERKHYIIDIINNTKTIGLSILKQQETNSDAHFMCRCNFAARIIACLIHACKEVQISNDELVLLSRYL